MAGMADSSGWWASKLGNGGNRPPPEVTAFRQPAPGMAPQGPPPQAWQAGHPMAPPGPQYQAPQQPPQVTPENFFTLAQFWTGGEAHAKERTPCPQCGGQHYFSRAHQVSRGPAPAPMCADCGYNGMFVQGDAAVWQSA